MKSLYSAFFVSFLLINSTNAQQKLLKPVFVTEDQPFGLVFNENGERSFVSSNPLEAEKLLRKSIDYIHKLGIKTLVYSVGAGSDVLYYPTKVASQLGWKKTKYEEQDLAWKTRLYNARACLGVGLDAVKIAGSQAKSLKMLFVPSLRMNDSRFTDDPQNSAYTGKFWLDNADLTIKSAPNAFKKEYANLLDYSHEKVRNHRLGVIFEAIDRNKAIIDGFELDFTRIQVLFPDGKSDAGATLITEMLRKVRAKLNANAKLQGRPMYLLARIPPSEEACKIAGLDIDLWMKEGLVDMVSPSQLMTLAQDMPIESMITKAHKYKVKVYPTLMPKSNFKVPLKPSLPTLGLNVRVVPQEATLEESITAVVNYRQMGADGFYLFNYDIGAFPEDMFRLTAEINNKGISSVDKVFVVTKTYHNDDKLPSYSYAKQLPAKTQNGKSSIKIYLGELPQASPYPLIKCILRLGIRNSDGAPKLFLNGKQLEILHVEDHMVNPRIVQVSDAAQQTLIYKIDQPSLLKLGNNSVEISAENVTLTDLEIAYGYMTNLSYMVRGLEDGTLNSPVTGSLAPKVKWDTSIAPKPVSKPKPKPDEEIENN